MQTLNIANAELSNINLVILDKDGTIFDVHHYWCSMIMMRSIFLCQKYLKKTELVESLASEMGVDHKNFKLKPEGPVGIKPRTFIVDVVVKFFRDNNVILDSTIIEEDFKRVDQDSLECLDDLLVFLPGVEDFLKECVSRNVKLAIATTDITSRAKRALEVKGIDKDFDYIIGADQVEITKPNPGMGNRILNELNLLPENSVMIGDHNVDIEFGKNLNLKASIGVATGLKSFDSLKEAGEIVINNFKEICFK